MKAEELMVGDFLRFRKVEPLPDNYVKIHAIKYNYQFVNDYLFDIVFLRSGHIQYNYSPRSFEPILLTPEILEKNGFKEKNIYAETLGDEIFGDEGNGCGLSGWYDGSWEFETFTPWTETAPDGSPEDWGFRTETRITRIKYVHELQHALRLCGIEKEIEL